VSQCTCGCIGTEVVPHGLWVIMMPWLAGRACQNTQGCHYHISDREINLAERFLVGVTILLPLTPCQSAARVKRGSDLGLRRRGMEAGDSVERG
jgi:hypothetical protein